MILGCKFCKNNFSIDEELSNLEGKLIKCLHCKEEWIYHSQTYFLESRLAELDQDLKKIEVQIDNQNNKHNEDIRALEKDLANKKNELNRQKLLEEKVSAFEVRITDTEKLESVQAKLENQIFQLEKDVKETSEDRMDEDGNYDDSITSTITPVIFFFYVYYLRRMYRAKNSIGEQYCRGCEDTLCALCCPQCVLCQISRHYNSRRFAETLDLDDTHIV